MSIAETTTRFFSSRPRSRSGWNIGGTTSPVPIPRRLLVAGEPGVHPVGELRVAQPQVVVGDPAAAGHDVERELLGLLAGVLAEVLEPLQAGLRGALGGRHDRPRSAS